ncbi:putative heterokaryon incompatibility protein [Paramyrothecium foliicola]|nr:putative heterokaryon incompatibility protein [Paramyrothecium foliicola]
MLKSCLETHEACQNITPRSAWYPTRLIELTQDGARVICPAETTPQGPYASLSYCWGGSPGLKCLETNIEEMESSINLQSLPLTIKDAFKATQALGLQYIWVDSLCIIQDSPDDWSREAGTMQDIYRNAVVNLAAAYATNSDGGLFHDRDADLLCSNVFSVPNGPLQGRYVAAAELIDWRAWDKLIGNAKLNTRGWVLQERLLSPRIIHFTADYLIWDCPSEARSETVDRLDPPMSSLHRYQRYSASSTLAAPKFFDHIFKDPGNSMQAVGRWGDIVASYSKSNFTYDNDRLVALLGIAAQLSQLMNDTFICGLWRSMIVQGLCWHASGKVGVRTHLAPSWSWLSIVGAEIFYPPPLERLDSLLTIVDVQVTTHKHTSCKGQIHMRCVCNHIDFHENGPQSINGVPASMFHFRGDVEEAGYGPSATLWREAIHNGEKIFAVFVHVDLALVKNGMDRDYVWGILLKPTSGTPGTYVRCGLLHVWSIPARDATPDGVYPDWFRQIMNPGGKTDVPCLDYNEKTGHLIKII